MADPAFPTVPNAPGVPPVAGGNSTENDNTVVQDQEDVDEGSGGITVQGVTARWGIFNKGTSDPALEPTSFLEVEDAKDFAVGRFPVEEGGFASYNKVETPEEITVTVAKSGADSVLSTFNATVNNMLASLDLYSVYTPGRLYKNMNLVHRDIHRTSEHGVTLLTVRLHFIEIRTSVETAFTNVTADTAANNVNQGSVQGIAPTASQTPGSAPQ